MCGDLKSGSCGETSFGLVTIDLFKYEKNEVKSPVVQLITESETEN